MIWKEQGIPSWCSTMVRCQSMSVTVMETTGCLCCTVRDDLINSLNALVLPAPQKIEPPWIWCAWCSMRERTILIISSLRPQVHWPWQSVSWLWVWGLGLANVSPIISTFYLADRLPERVRLDGVVTVVDAKHIERHMDDNALDRDANEAMEQIAYADRIIINKTDLVEVRSHCCSCLWLDVVISSFYICRR